MSDKVTLPQLMAVVDDTYGVFGSGLVDRKTGELNFMDHQDKHGKWWKMIPGADIFVAGVVHLVDSRIVSGDEKLSNQEIRDVADALESASRALNDLSEEILGLETDTEDGDDDEEDDEGDA